MQRHGSKYFAHRPPSTPNLPGILGLGSKDQNSTVLGHVHIAYQITGNHECSSMVATILPADPYSPDSWVEVKTP